MTSLTKQQWFDNAWERSKILIKSRRPSQEYEEEPICSYYPTDERPGCFIGVSLDFNKIEADLDEVGGAYSLYNAECIDVQDLGSYPNTHQFLEDLQNIHDDFEPSEWKKQLQIFATTHNLQVPT